MARPSRQRTVSLFYSAPPFELVQLSGLPQAMWRGLPVFHPNGQQGSPSKVIQLSWLSEDEGRAAYDVGVIVDWSPDELFEGNVLVRFLTGHGSSLVYSATNLWVPADILVQLHGPAFSP